MKRKANLFFVFFQLMGACFLVSWADLPPSAEIKYKSRDLDKVQDELNRKKLERELLKKEASQISQSLQDGESKLKGVQETLLHTRRKNNEVEIDLAQTKNSRDRLEKDIRETEKGVKGAFGVHCVVASLLGVDHPLAAYSRALYQSGTGRVGSLSRSREEVDQSFQELTATYRIVQNEFQTQRNTLNQLQSGLEDKERLLQKKQTRQQILEQEAKDLEKTAEELAQMIDILRSEAKVQQSEEKKARQQKNVTGHAPISRESLPWPLSGKVVKRYGRQADPGVSSLYYSNGIVIETRDPSPVKVVADGQVLYAGNFMSYGPMTVVEHKGDWYSVYGQLSQWGVEKGQELKKGDVVGKTGVSAMGKAETYFELRFYGKPVDPMPWLAAN